jgi:hypothetical protein
LNPPVTTVRSPLVQLEHVVAAVVRARTRSTCASSSGRSASCSSSGASRLADIECQVAKRARSVMYIPPPIRPLSLVLPMGPAGRGLLLPSDRHWLGGRRRASFPHFAGVLHDLGGGSPARNNRPVSGVLTYCSGGSLMVVFARPAGQGPGYMRSADRTRSSVACPRFASRLARSSS